MMYRPFLLPCPGRSYSAVKYRCFRWPRGWRYRSALRPKGVLPFGMNLWLSLFLLLVLSLPVLAASPQLTQGGGGVAVSTQTSGSLGASPGTYYIQTPSGTTLGTGSEAASATIGQFTVTPTGSTVADSAGGTVRTYTVSASSSAAVGTGYKFGVYPQSSGAPVYGLFDVAAASAPAPTASFSSSPVSISPGGSSTLTWSSTNATSVTIAVGSGAASSVGTSGSMSVSPSATTVYTLQASGSGGTATQTTTVTVTAPTVVSCAASPSSVYGSGATSVTLTITLSSAAPAGGASVVLTGSTSGGFSGNYSFASPLTIAYGSTSGTVQGTVTPTAPIQGTVSIAAAYNSTSATANIAVASGTGTGTGTSGTGASGSPGVSCSLSPYTVAPGGSSVLRWDTSGATTVSVNGVANPSASGSLNVSPSQTTTYTVTAANSSGTNSQTVTLTVDAVNGQGGSGSSAYTPGTTVSSSGGLFTGTNLPGFTIPTITIPGVTIPGLPTLPPLTLPGTSLPPISLPTLNIPGVTAPGDLKIGIPGLGSIGIPTGWLTQLISAAINPASIAQQFATFQGAQFNALATYNAGAAVNQAVRDGTATLQQINTSTSQQQIGAINSASVATQSVVNASSLATQNVITQTQTATQGVIKDVEKTAVTDFQGMITGVLQGMFIPDPSVLNQFEDEKTQFLNWGPYSFVTSFQGVLNSPASDGTVGGVPLGVPSLDVNPDAGGTLTIDPKTGAISGAPGFSWVATTAPPIPFNFSQVTTLPGWTFVRLLLGAGVWVLFISGVFSVLQPKQVF